MRIREFREVKRVEGRLIKEVRETRGLNERVVERIKSNEPLNYDAPLAKEVTFNKEEADAFIELLFSKLH